MGDTFIVIFTNTDDIDNYYNHCEIDDLRKQNSEIDKEYLNILEKCSQCFGIDCEKIYEK